MHGFHVDVKVIPPSGRADLSAAQLHAVSDAVHAIQEMADAFNDGRLSEEPLPSAPPTLAELAGGLALGLAAARPQKRPRRVTRGSGRRKS
jgi:hypothetical protein